VAGSLFNLSASQTNVGKHTVVEGHQFVDTATNPAFLAEPGQQSPERFWPLGLPVPGWASTVGRQYSDF
jgi:hypothetical protein